MSNMLNALKITKSFLKNQNKLVILNQADFKADQGDFISITGESGCGKSTFLNLIGGLDRPDCGTINLLGNNIAVLNEKKLAQIRCRSIGFVFQAHNLLSEFSALENVMLPGMIAGLKQKNAVRRASELLTEIGLAERMHHKSGELSGGEQQRVAVARAIMNNPPLLLADEPTGNLDETNSRIITDIFLHLNKKGTTVIIATHSPALAKSADIRYCLKNQNLSRLE
ncbi:MAG: hypothetical protein A2096_11685 [Spirochaetes bacterium GWF1_41_5]|nr:MAG: hypothetical protein A2096_11685 [Spirochaetes bacterium GWF1_41_5]